jgi:hypothetical protein
MVMTLTNLDKTLLILALNSGKAIYLGPGESSDPVEGIEINDNRKVEKLVKNGLLMVTVTSDSGAGKVTPTPGPSEPEPARTVTAPSRKEKAQKWRSEEK